MDIKEFERSIVEEHKKIKQVGIQERLDAIVEAQAFGVMSIFLSGQRPGYALVAEMHRAGVPVDQIERDIGVFRNSCLAAFNRITMAIRIIKEEEEKKKREGGGR